jgi:hypothetical protein
MRRSIWKGTGYLGVAACALALGACFPQTQPTVAVGAGGAYGGTVVAYPAPGYYSPYGYGYSPYSYDYGYGLPLGAEYLGYGGGYGYAPYMYAYPRVVVRQPVPTNRYAVPRGQVGNPGVSGEYGVGQSLGGRSVNGLHSPPAAWLGQHPANTAHPRFTLPPLRPSSAMQRSHAVAPTFNRPAMRRMAAPPPSRPQQARSGSRRH